MRILIIGMLLLNYQSIAQDNGDAKIGIARINYMIGRLPEMKEIKKQIQEFEDQFKRMHQSKLHSFDSKYTTYLSSKDTLPEVILREFENELEQMRISLLNFEEEAEISILEKQSSLLKPVQEKLFDSIDKFAVENHFFLILNDQVNGIPSTVYFKDAMDISDEVLARMQ